MELIGNKINKICIVVKFKKIKEQDLFQMKKQSDQQLYMGEQERNMVVT